MLKMNDWINKSKTMTPKSKLKVMREQVNLEERKKEQYELRDLLNKNFGLQV